MKGSMKSVLSMVVALGFTFPSLGSEIPNFNNISLANDPAINEAIAQLGDSFGEIAEEMNSDMKADAKKKYSQARRRNTRVNRKAKSPAKRSQPAPATPKVVQGEFQYVVCTEQTELLVRNSSLNGILFAAERFEPVKLFQGWGENRRYHRVNGRRLAFVKAQFPNHEDRSDNGIGWVAESLIKLKSECPGADGSQKPATPSSSSSSNSQSAPVRTEEPARPSSQNRSASITNLNDPDCCNFPLIARPTAAYDENGGMRRFGARRSGGRRAHAACDLYRHRNEMIEAVAPGKVIRNLYYFYQGTYALEVRHSGGFVVRYGEITGRQAKGVYGGASVRTGQTVGYMGKVNSNCCEPMLHFELFSGQRSGSLSSGGNKYQRRSDLMNPTAYLKEWERRKFSR